jgi:hypothetical protein
MEGLPEGMFELIGLRKVGAKTAYKLASNFQLKHRDTVLDEVKKLAQAGKIRELDGFSEKSEANILDAIENLKMNKSEKKRTLLATAEKVVERVRNHMLSNPKIEYCEAMGSFRRRAATIGDLDFAVACEDIETAIEHFLKFPEIKAAAADIFKYQSVFNQSILNVLKTASIRSTFDMVIHLVTDASGANIPWYISIIKEYQKRTKKATLNLYIMTDSYANVTAFQAVADASWKLTSLSKFPPTDAASALFQQLAEVQIFAVAPAAILDFRYALDRFIYVMQRNPKGFDFFRELNNLDWTIF